MTDDEIAVAEPAFAASVRFLYGLTPVRGTGATTVGLARMARLLTELGDPQEAVKTVHVAGTAGKGSVCALTTSLLVAHGFRVTTLHSPHVHTIRERLLVDGEHVEPGRFVELVDGIRPAVAAVASSEHGPPTFFEAMTAMAFRLAADHADYAVVETGLGGLLDATNTVRRADKLALLTTVGLDHTDVLGATLTEIAVQKAGILPRGGIALSAPQLPEVALAIALEAAHRNCECETVPPADGPLTAHRADNVALASRAVAVLAERDGWTFDDVVTRGSDLPGRFEIRTDLGTARPIVLDGAHNPLKLSALVADLRSAFPGSRFRWVVAFAEDKDLDGSLAVIAPLAVDIVATEFTTNGGDWPRVRSASTSRIARAARVHGLPVYEVAFPSAAARMAAGGEAPVVVAGSFHLMAPVTRALEAGISAGGCNESLRR